MLLIHSFIKQTLIISPVPNLVLDSGDWGHRDERDAAAPFESLTVGKERQGTLDTWKGNCSLVR